jgi:hypothetical protein
MGTFCSRRAPCSMRSLDLRGRMRSLRANCTAAKTTRKPLDRRGMLAALPPFCQNGVGYFATTDRSEFCRKISSFGFSPAVERLIAPFAGQGDQQAPIDRLNKQDGVQRPGWHPGDGNGLGRWIWMNALGRATYCIAAAHPALANWIPCDGRARRPQKQVPKRRTGEQTTRMPGCGTGPPEKFRAMPATNSKSVSLSRFANRASGSHAGKQAAGLLDATGVRRCGPVLRALPKQ